MCVPSAVSWHGLDLLRLGLQHIHFISFRFCILHFAMSICPFVSLQFLSSSGSSPFFFYNFIDLVVVHSAIIISNCINSGHFAYTSKPFSFFFVSRSSTLSTILCRRAIIVILVRYVRMNGIDAAHSLLHFYWMQVPTTTYINYTFFYFLHDSMHTPIDDDDDEFSVCHDMPCRCGLMCCYRFVHSFFVVVSVFAAKYCLPMLYSTNSQRERMNDSLEIRHWNVLLLHVHNWVHLFYHFFFLSFFALHLCTSVWCVWRVWCV